MGHDRERKQQHSQNEMQAPSPTGNAMQDAALRRRLKDRDPMVQQVRQELGQHVDRAAQALSIGANLFQMTVRGMDERSLEATLHPDKAVTIAHGVLGQIESKLKTGLVQVSGIGSDIASKASSVFGMVKGTLEKRIVAESKLTKLRLADIISSTLVDNALRLGAALKAAVAALPPEKIQAIGGVLDQAEEGKAVDPDDSPERGNLGEGLRAWAMTKIGLPAGDLVAAEEIAIDAFTSFQSQVGAAGTAAEQIDAVQHTLKHPDEPKERVHAAEGQMGPEFQKQMARDKAERGRVETVTP